MDELSELKKKIEELEKKKELQELNERLAKLEGNNPIEQSSLSYKSLEKNLQSGFSELGSQIGSIPHLMIPTPGDKKLSDKPNDSLFNEKEQKLMKKGKKWILIIGVLIIVGYASFRVLKGWLF